MQRNRDGVNADSHGTSALSCVGKFVREPNRTKRRGVKNAASPQRFLLSGGASFAGPIRTFVLRSSIKGEVKKKHISLGPEFFLLTSPPD